MTSKLNGIKIIGILIALHQLGHVEKNLFSPRRSVNKRYICFNMEMKRSILVIVTVLSLSSFTGNGQTTDSLDVYAVGLSANIEYLKSLKTVSDFQSVFVEKNYLTTDNLPGKIGDVTVMCLTKREVNAFTTRRKRIRLIVIQPVVISNNSVSVSVRDFFAASRHNSLSYVAIGRSVYIFRYDCEKGRFELHEQGHGE